MAYKCFCYSPETLEMPHRCIVCDSGDAEVFHYTQGHFPIPLPIVSIHTQSAAAVPYCVYHRDAFLSRFRILKIIQYVLIVGFFGCCFAGFSLQEHDDDWNYLMVVGIVCLLLLPITLIVRHFLYDAFFRFWSDGVLISSRHKLFIDNLVEANRQDQPE